MSRETADADDGARFGGPDAETGRLVMRVCASGDHDGSGYSGTGDLDVACP